MDLTERRDKASFLTGIVGDNGTGKTTVLQAIALILSLATNKINCEPQCFSMEWICAAKCPLSSNQLQT